MAVWVVSMCYKVPNESVRESLKVASRVRLFLSNQAMQSTPELDNVDVELEMSYSSSKFDEVWTHRQIAIAEYLDTLSELSARLDSLQNFAALCESRNVKTSKDILPDANAESGLYILPKQ